MQPDPEEKALMGKPAKFARSWPLVGVAMLALVFGPGLSLSWSNPLLSNPWVVVAGIESGSVASPMLTRMAALLPLVMPGWLLVVVVGPLLSVTVFANEHRHLAIIRGLTGQQTLL